MKVYIACVSEHAAPGDYVLGVFGKEADAVARVRAEFAKGYWAEGNVMAAYLDDAHVGPLAFEVKP